MKDNILDAMCRGIDECDVFIVFPTVEYMDKVASGNDRDNVRREFMHCANSRPDKMIVVRFDKELPSVWKGPVAMILGSRLYIDMPHVDPDKVDELVQRIRHKNGKTLWKIAHRKAPLLTTPRRMSEPPPLVKRTSSSESIRERVHSVVMSMGDTVDENEHIGETVDRLLQSIGEKWQRRTFFCQSEAARGRVGSLDFLQYERIKT